MILSGGIEVHRIPFKYSRKRIPLFGLYGGNCSIYGLTAKEAQLRFLMIARFIKRGYE